MRRTIPPVLTVLLLSAAACSSATGQAQTIIATTTTGGSTTSASVAVAGYPSSAQLQADLLSINDMPAGWTTASSSGSSGLASCSALNNGSWRHLPSSAEAEFKRSSFGPYVDTKLIAGPAAQETAAWNAFTAASNECTSFTSTDSSGTTRWTLSGLSFPKYGDATFALAITGTSPQGISATGDVVIVRKGNVIAEVIVISIGSPDVSLAEQMVSTAVTKAP